MEFNSTWASLWQTLTYCPWAELRSDAFDGVRSAHGIEPDDYTFRELFISFPGAAGVCGGWGGMAATACAHPRLGIPRPGGCMAWYKAPGAVGLQGVVVVGNLRTQSTPPMRGISLFKTRRVPHFPWQWAHCHAVISSLVISEPPRPSPQPLFSTS